MVNKPSKATGARGRSRARTRSEPAGEPESPTRASLTKKELEREVAALSALNHELRTKLQQQQTRADELARINRLAGERVDSAIGRIRTLLAS